jgi:hypothetical protein
MLELALYGVTGLVAIRLVALCFARKEDSASLSDKRSRRSMDDAELRYLKGVERCTCAPRGCGLRSPKHEGVLNG